MSDAKALVGIAVGFVIISWEAANSFGAPLGGLVVVLAGLFFLVVLVSYLVGKSAIVQGSGFIFISGSF